MFINFIFFKELDFSFFNHLYFSLLLISALFFYNLFLSTNFGFCFSLESEVAQSCPTLCDPIDYTAQGILLSKILKWVAIPFSRGSSQPRDENKVSCIGGNQRSPGILEWAAYPFSRRSSSPRNQTGVSCIADGFYNN